jgi:hypothetical protein
MHGIELAVGGKINNLSVETFAGSPASLGCDGRLWYNSTDKRMAYSEYNGSGILVPCSIADKADVDLVQTNLDAHIAKEYTYETQVTNQCNTTTMTDIPGLVTDELPIGVYRWEVVGRFLSSSSSNGVGFRVRAKTGTVPHCAGGWHIQVGNNGTSGIYFYNQTDGTVNSASTGVPNSNTDYHFEGVGVCHLSTPGQIVVQVRSELSSGIITLEPHVVLVLKKVR